MQHSFDPFVKHGAQLVMRSARGQHTGIREFVFSKEWHPWNQLLCQSIARHIREVRRAFSLHHTPVHYISFYLEISFTQASLAKHHHRNVWRTGDAQQAVDKSVQIQQHSRDHRA